MTNTKKEERKHIQTFFYKCYKNTSVCKDLYAYQSSMYLMKSTINNNNVKCYYNLKKNFLFEYILKCNWLLWSKLIFQHHYCSLQSHDPSEIILIWWFAVQETILTIINVEKSWEFNIFGVNCDTFFQDYLMNRTLKKNSIHFKQSFYSIIL